MVRTLIQNDIVDSQVQRMVRHWCLDFVGAASKLFRARDFLVHLNNIAFSFLGDSILYLIFGGYFIANNLL
ncbi:MAG: Uncharacterised protein [SAR92 bacterium MED-G29]|nr:MAG: Uncharacterised protein [SAR92 bacterium MED-G29]